MTSRAVACLWLTASLIALTTSCASTTSHRPDTTGPSPLLPRTATTALRPPLPVWSNQCPISAPGRDDYIVTAISEAAKRALNVKTDDAGTVYCLNAEVKVLATVALFLPVDERGDTAAEPVPIAIVGTREFPLPFTLPAPLSACPSRDDASMNGPLRTLADRPVHAEGTDQQLEHLVGCTETNFKAEHLPR